MTNLLSDLYRFRQRDTKNALEDFLTEGLAAILRVLPTRHIAAFLEQITGQDCHTILEGVEHISFLTQYVIERNGGGRQRPDLVVMLDHQPWLLFENKVAASIDQTTKSDGSLESQLHRYAYWLAHQPFEVASARQALVFITHNTPVPNDFVMVPAPPVYEGLGRHHSNWGKLCRLLEAITSGDTSDLHYRALIESFRTFLEDQNLSNEYPTPADIALLGLYMSSADKVGRIADEMILIAERVAPTVGNRAYSIIDNEDGTLYSARNVRPAEFPVLEMKVGFWYPNEGDGWLIEDVRLKSPAVTNAPKLFFLVAAKDGWGEADGVPAPNENWHQDSDGDYIAFIDYDAITGTSDDKHQAIMSWTAERVDELKAHFSLMGDLMKARAAKKAPRP